MGLKRLQGAAWAGLKHLLQAALAVCLVSAAALAALEVGAQPPPGSEGPNYYDVDGDGVLDDDDTCPGEKGPASNEGCPERVETIVVVHNKHRCPNGRRVGHFSQCPFVGSLPAGYFNVVYYRAETRRVEGSVPPNAPPCGSQPDANCACGIGMVKVYDEDEDKDEFHCKPAPPDEGCPEWDQTFDFSLRVWKCVTQPLDADPKKFAERVKNCGAPTVKKYWNHSMILAINYGFSSGQPNIYGTAGCHPDHDEPPRLVDEPPEGITVTFFRSALENAGGQYSSDWHWAALAPIHEYLHVDDFIRFDSCAPWETSAGQAAMRDAGYTERDFNQAGFEKWVRVRSWDEYRNVFGVRAPEDPEYISGKHNKPLSCLFAQ